VAVLRCWRYGVIVLLILMELSMLVVTYIYLSKGNLP
jgi:hypothetical protein